MSEDPQDTSEDKVPDQASCGEHPPCGDTPPQSEVVDDVLITPEDITRLGEFLSHIPNTRVLDYCDPEDDPPLPPGFRLLTPEDVVDWSPRSYSWPQPDGEEDMAQVRRCSYTTSTSRLEVGDDFELLGDGWVVCYYSGNIEDPGDSGDVR